MASSILVGGAGLAALFSGLWRLAKGPERLWSLGLVLLATTPVIWTTVFLTDLARRSNERDAIAWRAPQRIAILWLSSIMDAEARWRYSRWTEGRHVVLIDDAETPKPANLVAQMDEHIERMAALLEQPLPTVRFRWVRGPLLGRTGQEIGAWAICAREDQPEVTSLDRHEVSHAVINGLCGWKHDAPALLFEGWAEYQSKDPDKQLRWLSQRQAAGHIVRLDKMIAPDRYRREQGPVYWEGGPLVRFLTEQFGAPKFFELYSGVQEATFAGDFQRILGTSWLQFETDFWQWVKTEAVHLPTDNEELQTDVPPPWEQVELAASVDPLDWQTIVDGYRAANEVYRKLPTNVAVAVQINHSEITNGVTTAVSSEMRAIFQDGSTWFAAAGADGSTQHVLVTPNLSGEVRRGPAFDERHFVNDAATEMVAKDAVHQLWWYYVQPSDPTGWLPLSTGRPYSPRRIEGIIPPTPPATSPWTVLCRQSLDVDAALWTLELDREHAWHVARARLGRTNDLITDLRFNLRRLGGAISFSEFELIHTRDNVTFRTWATLRTMNEAEQRVLRRAVEAAITERPPTADRLTRPATIAVAWPSVGLLLMTAHFALQRSRV